MTTLLTNGRIWQWSHAALAGPKAMLAAADDGTAHTLAEWMLLEHGRIVSIGKRHSQPFSAKILPHPDNQARISAHVPSGDVPF